MVQDVHLVSAGRTVAFCSETGAFGPLVEEEVDDGLFQRRTERDCPAKTGSIHDSWEHPPVGDIWTFRDVWKTPILARGCCKKK